MRKRAATNRPEPVLTYKEQASPRKYGSIWDVNKCEIVTARALKLLRGKWVSKIDDQEKKTQMGMNV